jgi:hypothetical protein
MALVVLGRGGGSDLKRSHYLDGIRGLPVALRPGFSLTKVIYLGYGFVRFDDSTNGLFGAA